MEKQPDVANGKPKLSVPNGVNGDLKVPAEKVAAAPPAVTYAAKVAQNQKAATEKPVLANQKAPTEKPVLANGAVKTAVA